MRRFVSLGISLSLLLIVVSAFIFRQDISDYLRLRNYVPPAEVAMLADSTTLLPGARRLFYVHRPELTDKTTFNTYCRGHDNEYTIVLGCYIQTQGIYLLDVEDERLSGIKEVTAGHELLHAAYDRLSTGERKRIDSLLLSFYNTLNDERIKQTIEVYRNQDESIVPNELHSIIGTEVRTLTTELEEYYGQYFGNRSQIVSFSEQYEQAFIERRNQIRAYDDQLSGLKQTIDSQESELKQTSQELQDQRGYMNELRSSGQIESYNAQVPIYNARVNQYNKDINNLSALIVQYNDLVQKRNSIAEEEAELVEAIDSREVVPEQQ
jgi:predicted  nucleic acid-binding Zn-ribbon protein